MLFIFYRNLKEIGFFCVKVHSTSQDFPMKYNSQVRLYNNL